MPRAEEALPLRHAVALGLLQGPAELLPVSSSAHTALLPWLAGWPSRRLDGEARKSFEVALHAGATAALAIEMRGELAARARTMDARAACVLGLALAPAAIIGYALRGPIERRLGGPRSIAVGLAGGGLAMALADVRAAGARRRSHEARARDGLALGLAQAVALMPGVSRHGATLAAARMRGFDRAAAQALSWETGLPVILAAVALKGVRLLSGAGPEPGGMARVIGPGALAAGCTSAFASTLASARALRRGRRSGRALAPYAAYRLALALVVLLRGRCRSRGE
jgi:undecaprenyl-diphosphatase